MKLYYSGDDKGLYAWTDFVGHMMYLGGKRIHTAQRDEPNYRERIEIFNLIEKGVVVKYLATCELLSFLIGRSPRFPDHFNTSVWLSGTEENIIDFEILLKKAEAEFREKAKASVSEPVK